MDLVQLQINRALHQLRNIVSRYRLRNRNVTIISSNCIGGVMYHDLKLQFRSPTVNLFFDPEDFLKYASNLKYYNSLKMEETTEKADYPIGKVGDVKIHFLHYNSFKDAENSWNKRKERINYDNLVVIMTDQGVEQDRATFNVFEAIPYPKVYFTNKHTGYKWSQYISGFDGRKWLGNTIEYAGGGRRYYEQFDYVKFLNSALIKNRI